MAFVWIAPLAILSVCHSLTNKITGIHLISGWEKVKYSSIGTNESLCIFSSKYSSACIFRCFQLPIDCTIINNKNKVQFYTSLSLFGSPLFITALGNCPQYTYKNKQQSMIVNLPKYDHLRWLVLQEEL